MIEINNIEYRNLEEQVLDNTNTIRRIIDSSEILNSFGIKVVGNVDTETILNETYPPETYLGAYGDAFLVGTEPPYDYYIFTRPFPGEEYPQWFNIGQFPLQGPQGEQGPAGIVTRGDRGSMWYVGTVDPANFSPAVNEIQVFNNQDLYINSATGNFFQYNGSNWIPKGNLLGPRGATGVPGQRGSKWYSGATSPGQAGLSGVQAGDMYLETGNGNIYQTFTGTSWVRVSNIRGPKGDQGKNATAVTIVAELASVDQLPTPSTSIRNNAYIVDISGVYHLYVITQVSESDTTLEWTDMGPHGGSQIYVSGQPVDIWNADTKAPEISPESGFNLLYTKKTDGTTTGTRLSSVVIGNTVPLRLTSGTIRTAEPTNESDCATKKYVDDAVANAGGGGGSAPTVHTMSVKISSAWLVDKVLAYSTKEGHGPPISFPSVETIPEAGMFSLNGAYSSAGYSRLFAAASFDYPETAMNYNLSLDTIAFNNVAGLSTSEDRVLCRSYFTFNSVVEKNEYGVIYDATLYFFA